MTFVHFQRLGRLSHQLEGVYVVYSIHYIYTSQVINQISKPSAAKMCLETWGVALNYERIFLVSPSSLVPPKFPVKWYLF